MKTGTIESMKLDGSMIVLRIKDDASGRLIIGAGDHRPMVHALEAVFGELDGSKIIGGRIAYALETWGGLAFIAKPEDVGG